jgi:hypothetical protein
VSANEYLDVNALGQVLVVAVVVGAGLMALFGFGVVAMSRYGAATRGGAGGRLWAAAAGLCFLACLAAVGAGLAVMISG